MASHYSFVTFILVLLTSQLVKGRTFSPSVHECKETTWGPNLLYGQGGSSFLQLRRLIFGFPTEKECIAAMCAPRCTITSNPAQPASQTLPVADKPTSPTRITDLRPPNDVRLGLPKKVPTGSIKEIKELQAVLGPQSKLITDKDGQVIGVEAPSSGDGSTSSRPSPQTDSSGFPKSDYSICCSTREVFYFNQTLVDYFGRTQVIAQINEVGVYQLIRHGFCGSTGACTGQCDQIYVTLPLVVHPTQAGQQVSFSLFKIPGYCTCRVSALAGMMALQG